LRHIVNHSVWSKHQLVLNGLGQQVSVMWWTCLGYLTRSLTFHRRYISSFLFPRRLFINGFSVQCVHDLRRHN